MKRIRQLSIFLALFISMMSKIAYAYNIIVENDYGVSIYYNYYSERELIVTYDDYLDRKYTGTVIIPNEVTYMNRTLKVIGIGEKAFNNCSNLTSVSIPSSVTTIGERAFEKCTSLTSVIIPDGVITVGKFAFHNCSSLVSVNISNTVTSIGDEAFSGCSALASITIGNSVTSIGSWAFSGCRLNSVYISDITAWCSIKFNRESNPLRHAKLYLNGEEVKDLVIPNSMTSIGEYTFEGCTSLTSVTIGNSITSIGIWAFKDCNCLNSVYISDMAAWCAIKFNSQSNPLGNNALLYLNGKKVKDLVIPNSVTNIGEYTFGGCTSLTSVLIGKNVKGIGYGAFSNCPNLTSVTIPKSVSSIGKAAFLGCNKLSYVISQIENPFGIYGKSGEMYYRTFDQDVFNNSTLYVPKGKKEKYKTTEGWKDFLHIEEGTGPNGSETPEVQKCIKPTIGYQNGKLTFNCETEDAICQYTITDDDIKSESGNEIQLSVAYYISVYATKSGYENSETATATLCWIDVEPQSEGLDNSVSSIAAKAVMVKNDGSFLTIEGIEDGVEVNVYSLTGIRLGSSISRNGVAQVKTNLTNDSIAIVMIGNKSIKIKMK